MDKSIWEKTIGEDANEEGVKPCDKSKGRICAKKGKDVSIV